MSNNITTDKNEGKSLYTLKDKFRCLFCGGKKCPNEDYRKNPNTAIIGLNCDLIDNSVYASQRPSNKLIFLYNLVQKFKENKISMIINLQRPGEHPYCGPNTLDKQSGYSYTPSLFSTEGINVKLCGWKDMDVPDSLYFMLDIVKEMVFTIDTEKKRVLVHCHAGKGRTGVVIACYLIFKYHINADESIKRVRMKRPKCIESSEQREYCNKFFTFIKNLRMIFTKEKMDIYSFIKHQNDLLLKMYNNQNNYENETTFIPKILTICINKLIELKNANQITKINICKALNGSYDINDEMYNNISSIMENINKGNWKQLERCQDVIILSEILFIWLDDCVKACIYPDTMEMIFNENKKLFKQKKSFIDYIFEYKNLDNETITTMYSYIKSIFKKYEWEILKFFAYFLKEIYPSNNHSDERNLKEEVHEYKHMIEKLSIFILGYNIDILYENGEEESKNYSPNYFSKEKTYIFNNVQSMILILKFLRDTLIENKKEYYDLHYLYSPRKTNKKINNNNNINNNNKNINNKVPNIDMNKLNFLESSILNNTNLNSLLELDNPHRTSLFNIYQTLKLHFEKKEALNKVNTNDNQNLNVINPNNFLSVKKKSIASNKNSSKNSFNFNLKPCDYNSNDEDILSSNREKSKNLKIKKEPKNYRKISAQNIFFNENNLKNSITSSNKKINIYQIKNITYQEGKPLENNINNINKDNFQKEIDNVKNKIFKTRNSVNNETIKKLKLRKRSTIILNKFFQNGLKNSNIINNNNYNSHSIKIINNSDFSSNNSSLLNINNNNIHVKNNN